MPENESQSDESSAADRQSRVAAGEAAPPLRHPADHPGADVVIYDGQCPFCRSHVARLARWDSGRRLTFVSSHDPLVAERFPDLLHEQLMEQMYVISGDGRRRGGAAALRYLTRRLPRLWPLAPLLHLPGSLPLWRWLYRQIARRRYRLQEQDCGDACRIDRR